MRKLFLTFDLVGSFVLTFAIVACGGGRTTSSEEPVTDSTDIPIEQLMLPDTSYASVEAVKYVVENTDSLPHPLKDFNDRYDGDNVMAFRKNLMRNAAFGGKVTGTPKSIEIAWEFTTDYDTTHTKFGVWGGGSGWTGQPLYVKWTDEQIAAFKQSSPGLTPDFGREEIIVGSLCGKGYFINYETGKASRQPLDLGNVVKGTVSLDPELYNLYVGQGVPRGAGPFGCQAFDLLKHQRTFFFGPDPKAWRSWNAFDSSPIVTSRRLLIAKMSATKTIDNPIITQVALEAALEAISLRHGIFPDSSRPKPLYLFMAMNIGIIMTSAMAVSTQTLVSSSMTSNAPKTAATIIRPPATVRIMAKALFRPSISTKALRSSDIPP